MLNGDGAKEAAESRPAAVDGDLRTRSVPVVDA
jgi:hypothetical protein